MKNTKSTCLALMAIMLAPLAANAVPITYDVNLDIGLGSVNGTITLADGALGDVTDTDITGFELTLFDGTDSFFMDNSNGFVTGGGFFPGLFTATPTELVFDFSLGGAGDVSFTGITTGSEWSWFLQNGSDFNGYLIQHLDNDGFDIHTPQEARDLGREVFGRAGPTGVPEPATLALLGLGLAGMGLSRVRRKTASI